MNRARTQRATIAWATHLETGMAKHISEVPRGLACGCICVSCRSVLEAVNSENPTPKRRMHFRHSNGEETDTCVTGAVLAGARSQLSAGTAVMLSAYSVTRQAKAPDGREFNALEQSAQSRATIEQIQWVDETDALLTLADGRQLRVRLTAVSGALKAERMGDDDRLAEILIDVSDPALRSADPNELRRLITLDTAVKRWCHHWQAPELVDAATRAAQGKADSYWADKQSAAAVTPTAPLASPPHLPTAPVSRILNDTELSSSPRYVESGGAPQRDWLSGAQPRAEPMWAASRQVAAEDRKKALTIAQAVYCNGDRGAAPHIHYPALLEEAIQAHASNQPLQEKLTEWQACYKMTDLKPILDVLKIARIIRYG